MRFRRYVGLSGRRNQKIYPPNSRAAISAIGVRYAAGLSPVCPEPGEILKSSCGVPNNHPLADREYWGTNAKTIRFRATIPDVEMAALLKVKFLVAYTGLFPETP